MIHFGIACVGKSRVLHLAGRIVLFNVRFNQVRDVVLQILGAFEARAL